MEKQKAQSIDDATRAAIEVAEAEFRRGEGVSLEEARAIVRKQHQVWQKTISMPY